MLFQSVSEQETFYVALHARKGNEATLRKVLAAIPPCIGHLKQFRLVLILFSNRIENVRFYHEADVFDVLKFPLESDRWQEGNRIDPVVNFAMSDHYSQKEYSRTKIFVYTDDDLTTHWGGGNTDLTGNLGLSVDFIWLGHKGLPIGRVTQIDFSAIAIETMIKALQVFALDVPATSKNDAIAALVGTGWATFGDFREAGRATQIARILTT